MRNNFHVIDSNNKKRKNKMNYCLIFLFFVYFLNHLLECVSLPRKEMLKWIKDFYLEHKIEIFHVKEVQEE